MAPAAPRIRAKDELRLLNERLACYIQLVRDLERERSSMVTLLEQKDESRGREMGTVRRLYEEELADIRQTLDGLAAERARLQIDYGNLNEEYRKLQTRNEKQEGELADALAQWRTAQAALSSREAEHSQLLADNRTLQHHFTDLQAQLHNVEGCLADTRAQLGCEMLQRVEMENQAQTLREELELQRNISEQEIVELRRHHESRPEAVDPGEFHSKLAEALQQLRQDHQAQLQHYKEHMDRTFTSKLENAQQAALENKEAASAAREELEATTLTVETLSSQLQQLRKDKVAVEGRCQELERMVDAERDVWHQKLSEKEQELLSTRSQMSSQLEEYEQLLGVKLSLDMEINAYRKMLELEEQRLQLSPSPSRSHQRSSRRPRGSKRSHQGVSVSSSAPQTASGSTESGAVTVAEVDVEGKYVRLKNNSDKDQSLAGWVVRRIYPESGDVSFHIPPSCVLAAGHTLTIWAAGAEAQVDGGNLIVQGHRSWSPATDGRVVLLNSSHEEVAEGRVSAQSRGDTDPECGSDSDSQHLHRQPKRKKKKCCSVC